MRIAVLDLEMNQPSGKVIQIAAINLDIRSGKLKTDGCDIIVNPEEELSDFIVNLTGITQRKVDAGVEYEIALLTFWDWVRTNNIKMLCSWGTDHWTLVADSKDRGIEVPRLRYLDVKSMFQILKCGFPSGKIKGGLANTLKMYGIEFEGRQHDAFWDAYNTAKLLVYARNLQKKHNEITKLLIKDRS